METKLLTEEFANKVYDVLVEHGGAKEDTRSDFIFHHCEYEYGCMEWRFMGKLGSGGKYRSERNGVSYYPESETSEMVKTKILIEEELSKIKIMGKRDKCVGFAYFGDGAFLGWYADSFGSIREDEPKVYGYTDSQVEVITRNFRNKLNKLKEESELNKLDGRLGIIDVGMNEDKTILSQYKTVQLRLVECPEYDGPNPDFDKEAYDVLKDAHREKLREEGILDIPAGRERRNAIDEFEKTTPAPDRDTWIYCDYSKVKEWASKEPTEFIGVIDKE